MADRWTVEWPEDAPPTDDGLGDHAATRYRHFRRFIEGLDGGKLDYALFGLVLSVEGMRDEMRAYDQQASEILRLAQTGHFVRQLQRLNGALDAACTSCTVDESVGMKEWKVALDQERSDRVARYNALLMSLETDDSDQEDANTPLLRAIETDEQQEEAMTLLKAAIDKYGHDILTPEEVQITNKAFHIVARHANTVVISLPTWLVMPSEFSSTFGLSRWGNDLLTPEHSDKSRFIEEATTWSKLNHPHVAKFLGACHVGDRPFIVHESVRSLSEYLGEGMDRQKVWQRMYEVALALQYLHERGLVCDDLTLESVYCGLFDAKAMLLGVGLVESVGYLTPNADTGAKHEAAHGSLVKRDIESLRMLSLESLQKFEAQNLDDSSSTEEDMTDAASEADEALRLDGRPAYLNDAEWEALTDIRRVDGASPGAILLVIERFKVLAGIAEKKDWGDDFVLQAFDLQAAEDIGSIVVPALGKTITEILSGCAEMSLKEDPEKHIHARLEDVFDQLVKMDLHEVDASSLKDLVARFVTLLARLHRLLEQKTRADPASRVLMEEQTPVSTFAFHSDIDRLLEIYNLSRTNSVHLWRPQWELLSSRHQFAALSTLIRHPSPKLPVVPEEDSTRTLHFDQVVLAILATLRISHNMVDHIRGHFSDAGILNRAALPRWFLPPTEVEFKSFAEFSRGAFGSVHLGKWFNTRVVVKRVFTDMDDRATVQDQFRREADVWFKLNHINVVKMYGACHIDQPFFVCEYASGGNLDSYLEREGRDPRLVWYSLLNAALGLQYLHDNGIVHADLKGNNILVGADGVAKLTDFGLSVSARSSYATEMGGAVGAYRWKAPETLPSKGVPGKSATFASDVYSFAMVMIEIVSGGYPWGDSIPDAAVAFHVKRGRLPARPPGFDDPEWGLIERMCHLDPAQRVTIDAVVVHLLSLIERLDATQLRPAVDPDEIDAQHKNRIVARSGALLSLLELAKSTNERLSWLATEHFLSVSINRAVPADVREVSALVELMRSGSEAEKAWAAHASRILAWSSAQNKVRIAEAGGIPPLVALLRDGSDGQKRHAVGALKNLATNDRNKELITAAGGIPALIALACDGSKMQQRNVVGALSALASSDTSRALIASAGGIPVLVAAMRDGDDALKEKAASALCSISRNGDYKAQVVAAGVVPMLSALAHGGGRVLKEKAARLMRSLAPRQ